MTALHDGTEAQQKMVWAHGELTGLLFMATKIDFPAAERPHHSQVHMLSKKFI
jgi:hypothetical protein